MARSTKRSTVEVDPIAVLTAQIAALAEAVSAMQGSPIAPATRVDTPRAKSPAKSPKQKPAKGAKVYTWKPWACAKFAIPSTVGMTFAYSGKNGTTDHVVTAVSADGIVSSIRA